MSKDEQFAAMRQFIADFVKNGCHYFCGRDSCSHAGKQRMESAERILATIEQSPSDTTPEGCILVAHDTGDGWFLGVEDAEGNTVAMLAWPEAWPEVISASRLHEFGFEIV